MATGLATTVESGLLSLPLNDLLRGCNCSASFWLVVTELEAAGASGLRSLSSKKLNDFLRGCNCSASFWLMATAAGASGLLAAQDLRRTMKVCEPEVSWRPGLTGSAKAWLSR